MKTVEQLKLTGKRVFIRCDFNVPLKGSKITDDLRIVNALETIKYVLRQKPKQIVLASHLGRPKPGSGEEALNKYSLTPIAQRLAKLLGKTVYLHANILAPIESQEKIVLLENLRFYEEEKKGGLAFAKQLASHADVYINDAFGTAHRKDASVFALAKLLPHGAGKLLQKESKYVHLNHKKPIVAIFGAAKIKDKLPLFKKLLGKVDKLILGGGVVFTFLKAADIEIGKSLVEDEMVSDAKALLKKHGRKIVFPVDFLAMTPSKLKTFDTLSLSEKKKLIKTVPFDAIGANLACYDVGPQSIKLFNAVLGNSKTVVWNGPLGMFEVKPFDESTKKIAKTIVDNKMVCIVCGGDTAAAVRKTKYAANMTHISTGGGAFLEYVEGKSLPAVAALEARYNA